MAQRKRDLKKSSREVRERRAFNNARRKIILDFEKFLISENIAEAYAIKEHISYEESLEAVSSGKVTHVLRGEVPVEWLITKAQKEFATNSDAARYMLYLYYSYGPIEVARSYLEECKNRGIVVHEQIEEYLDEKAVLVEDRKREKEHEAQNISRGTFNFPVQSNNNNEQQASRDTATKDISSKSDSNINYPTPPDVETLSYKFEGALDRASMAEALIAIMKAKKLSVRAIAAEAGVGKTMIQRIKTSESNLETSIEILSKLGYQFDMKVSEASPPENDM